MTQHKEAPGSVLGPAHARIRGIIAGGTSASAEAKRGTAELAPETESHQSTHAPEPENLPAERPGTPHSLTLAVVVGSLAGALMAVVTYFVLAELRPLQDPRVATIAKRVVGFEQSLEQQGQTLRGTEVDVARLVDQGAGIGQRMDSQAAKTDQAFAAIGETNGQVKALTGTSSPLFGIAVAQLGQALDEGRRFETEWVNLFSLTTDDPASRAVLAPLMPVSASGIETAAQLRERLSALAYERGVPTGLLTSPVQYGLLTLQTRLGLPLGYTAEALVAADQVAQADRHLAQGEVREAVAVLARLPSPQAQALGPWMEAARRHDGARKAFETLASRSRDRLQERARSTPP